MFHWIIRCSVLAAPYRECKNFTYSDTISSRYTCIPDISVIQNTPLGDCQVEFDALLFYDLAFHLNLLFLI